MITINKHPNFYKRKVRSKYSGFLPPPTPEYLEALYASIKLRGVDEEIVVDEDGNIVDGWFVQMICDELGIYCPRQVRKFGSESEKYEFALSRNCSRRQMNRQERRNLIAVYLRIDPAICDNLLATIIGGMGSSRVAEVRAKLIAENEIPYIEKLRGQDGKYRPNKYAKIIANSPSELAKAQKAINKLPPSCDGKYLDVTTATRRAARQRNKITHEERNVEPHCEGDIQLYHTPFQALPTVAGIKSGSVQLSLTDIPYGQEFVDQIEELAVFAEQVLVEGGLFVTYCGQYWLHKVINSLSKHLTYRWTMCSVWDGDATPVHIGGWKQPHGRVLSKWKPILIFSKGGFPQRGQFCDVSHINDKEKDWHPWQLPLGEVELLVRYFSEVGDLIVDPCAGGFTTAIACRNLGRRCIACDIDEICVQRGWDRLASTPCTRIEQSK